MSRSIHAHQNLEINISWKFHVIRCFKYFCLKGAIIGGRQLIEGCLSLFKKISIFFAKSFMSNSAKMYGRSDTPHGFTIIKKSFLAIAGIHPSKFFGSLLIYDPDLSWDLDMKLVWVWCWFQILNFFNSRQFMYHEF